MIELQHVKATAEEIVREFGEDHTYSNPFTEDLASPCLYVHLDADNNPVPGCLVAQILVRLGVPIDSFATQEGSSAYSLKVPVQISERARVWLCDVQYRQDLGQPWGTAVKETTA